MELNFFKKKFPNIFRKCGAIFSIMKKSLRDDRNKVSESNLKAELATKPSCSEFAALLSQKENGGLLQSGASNKNINSKN